MYCPMVFFMRFPLSAVMLGGIVSTAETGIVSGSTFQHGASRQRNRLVGYIEQSIIQ